LENKNIEKIDLTGKLLKIIKDNKITSKGFLNMKESLIKNKTLKEFCIDSSLEKTNRFNNEFHLVYKLLKLTKNEFDLRFSDNIYFLANDVNLKLNFFKCYIDEIDHLYFNFHQFDVLIIFL
jgi:hypothetical protein